MALTQHLSPLRPHWLLALLVLMLLTGCSKVEQMREAWYPPTPYNEYVASLRAVNLDNTALGKAWLAASDRLQTDALPITLPYHAVGFIDPAQPEATGYRIDVARGQRLLVTVIPDVADSAQVFLDLFSLPTSPNRPLRHVASGDSTMTLDTEAGRDHQYLLRIQPELLAEGRYTVTIQLAPSLVFPVSGKDSGAIRSFFGAPRDGGRRRHHGVDIFAARGTPVVATAPGYVTRVQNTRIGGKVVWVRDRRRNQVYYYAHLDNQSAQRNQRVMPGDTLGTVGNTGNARTTPPHLHFGIYSNGPVDPYLFIHQPSTRVAGLRVDTTRLGNWVLVSRGETTLRDAPNRRAAAIQELPIATLLRVVGGSGNWFKVQHPNQQYGFVYATNTRPLPLTSDRLTLTSPKRLHLTPEIDSSPIDSLSSGTMLHILGRHDAFLRVHIPNEGEGWILSD